MKTVKLAALALASAFLLSAAPMAAHADAGDRIERRLDRKGDRIDRRLDRRAVLADANGHPVRAERLDRRGDRIDRRLDRKGHRIERRLERRGH
jgi:Ni/Co efflux regulator RcnB